MARNPLNPFGTGLGLARGSGDPFLSLQREMNRLFDDAFRGMVPPEGRGETAPGGQNAGPQTSGGQTLGHAYGGQGYGQAAALVPHMDVSETDTELRIAAELPGVAENDVEVTLHEDVLTIRGEKKFERKDEKENYHFVERSYGTFQRSLRLPFRVEPDQVQAEFNNGVLTLTLPKVKAQDRARRIQVQGGSQQRVESRQDPQAGSEQSEQGGKRGKSG